jgi:hypothetical protein
VSSFAANVSVDWAAAVVGIRNAQATKEQVTKVEVTQVQVTKVQVTKVRGRKCG